MGLKQYHQKRNFSKTLEPKGRTRHRTGHLFVIQKHAARQLHYDFRLELDGVLLSWAIPKGPCLDPSVKRLAIHVEDHPVDYGSFEGIIPQGEYGGGTVMLWDKGQWQCLDKDAQKALEKGHLHFILQGEKLGGQWDLIRFKPEDKAWFLIKHKDDYTRALADYDITAEEPDSVLSRQSLAEIKDYYQAVWSKKGRVAVKSPVQKLPLPEAPLPEKLSPQLAVLTTKPPSGDNWLHEIKLDGYRILAVKNGNEVKLLSRNNKEWTDTFNRIAVAVKKLAPHKLVLDGELLLLDENHRSNFQLLQNSLKDNQNAPFLYYVFDVLYYEKWDVRTLPLLERKQLLTALLPQQDSPLIYNDHIEGQGEEFFKKCCNLGLEGIISKQKESHYSSQRSSAWVKVKCANRQEFVVGGFSAPQGERDYLGALLLGVYDSDGVLTYTGRVGTGFTQKSLQLLDKELRQRLISVCPFSSTPPDSKRVSWVQPELVVEVEFSEWTQDNRLRHPSFKGLRWDKKASEIMKDGAKSLSKENQEKASKTMTKAKKIHFTHAEKVLYEEDGITKGDLYAYYELVADYMLPYIVKRPLTLTRCPGGYKQCFYQKKLAKSSVKYLHTVAVESHKTHEKDPYIYIKDIEGLLSLLQLGVLEIHPWGSTIAHLEYPDILIFDLDPAEELPWSRVVAAACEIRRYLQDYQLDSFVKTTGGKGLHVVIPIEPDYDWLTVKQFTEVFVDFLVQINPKHYIQTMAKAKRKGKIFIDYLRNQRGASAIAAYSTRARIHAPVAVPIHWDELTNKQQDTYYTVKTLPQRLKHLTSDPWHDFYKLKQSLRLDDLK